MTWSSTTYITWLAVDVRTIAVDGLSTAEMITQPNSGRRAEPSLQNRLPRFPRSWFPGVTRSRISSI